VNYGVVTAVGLFQLIPVVIFYTFAQRSLLNLYSGGMKGSA
jgi:inositol-phosphate transport system permease protein